MNRPVNKAEWQILIQEYQICNLTQAEFCKQKNLVLSKFTYYLQQYRKLNNPKPLIQTPSFSQVVTSSSANSLAQGIKIELPNGFCCYVPCNIETDQLKKILGVLLTC